MKKYKENLTPLEYESFYNKTTDHNQCINCNASMKIQDYSINKMSCALILRMYDNEKLQRQNKIENPEDLHLYKMPRYIGETPTFLNYTKHLHYFGLIEPTGKHGWWRITPLGKLVLQGKEFPIKVWVWDGKVIKEDKTLTTLKQRMFVKDQFSVKRKYTSLGSQLLEQMNNYDPKNY